MGVTEFHVEETAEAEVVDAVGEFLVTGGDLEVGRNLEQEVAHDELVGQEPDPLGPVFRHIRCPVEDPHGLLEEAFGLGEGVVPAGLAMGEFQVGQGLGVVTAVV